MKKPTNILLFSACIIIGGVVSLILGQDVGFDLLNYHLYNPYAFLHDRLAIDLIPAGIAHSFFNPLPDIPFFLFFYYLNAWPRLTAFLKGGYYGMLLFALCKWLPLIFKGNAKINKIFRASVIIFSVTGLAAILQVGFSTTEELLAFFAVVASYLLFCGTNKSLQFRIEYLLFASFLVSLATGLKYTAAPAACGIGICCLFLFIRNKSPLKFYLYTMFSALSGFLLTNGYFLWRNWTLFKNPLFPFFNQIFKSPFFLPVALPNSTLTPHTWQEYLFLPLLRINFPDFGEYRLDFRLLLGIISFVILACSGIYQICKKKSLSKHYLLLMILFIGTYVPWIIVFGNLRYSIFLEILSCLLFTVLLSKYISKKFISISLIILSLLSLFLGVKPLHHRQRRHFDKKNITFSQKVVIPDDALVIIAGHHSALIPFLNPKARYIGGIRLVPQTLQTSQGDVATIQPLHPDIYYKHNFPIRQEIKEHTGPIYILVPFLYWTQREAFWKEYGIDTKSTYCQVFNTNLIQYSLALCHVDKIL